MKTIKLSDTVMVSDPCYTTDVWCMHKLTGVLPGEYLTTVMKSDKGDWGSRVGLLVAVHKNYAEDTLTWRTVEGADIGVDSGQCGIFSIEGYRNDELFTGEAECGFGKYKEGDNWYNHMCDMTLSKEQWGAYDTGVVSTSGYGDGSYRLLVAKVQGNIVGIGVDFLGYKNLAFNLAMEIAAE
jgi:hypothetical protein